MSIGPNEHLSGYHLVDTYGRRQFTLRNLNEAPLATDNNAAAGLFDADGREQIVIQGVGNSGASYPFINVKSAPYNATGAGVVDDYAAVQAALDAAKAAGGGTVMIPKGVYRMSAKLKRAAGVDVNIIGEGHQSVLYWPTSLGTGVPCLDFDTGYPASNDYTHRTISQIRFTGPGGHSFGTAGNQMYGPITGPNDVWSNVYSDGFFCGAAIAHHHETFSDCVFTANFYGAYFTSSTGDTATYDQSFRSTLLTGNFMASLAVAAGEICGTASFVKTHFGFSPYCIYKEAVAGAAETFLDLATFTCCTFEQYGNGVIYDESFKNNITNCHFVGCTDSVGFNATYKVTGRNTDYAIYVGNLVTTKFDQAGFGLFATPGTLGVIRALSVDRLRWEDCQQAIDRCVAASKKMIVVTNGCLATTGRSHGDRELVFRTMNAACAVGDLLFRDVSGYCSKGSATALEPLGVCAQASTAFGDIVPVYRRGLGVNVKVTGTPTAPSYLKPSGSFDGAVIAATSRTDGATIGVSIAAASGGFVSADLYL